MEPIASGQYINETMSKCPSKVGKHSTERVGSGFDPTASIIVQFAVVFSPPIPACLQLEKYFQFYCLPLYWILV